MQSKEKEYEGASFGRFLQKSRDEYGKEKERASDSCDLRYVMIE